jgi:ParB family chromosome partitioning protein
MQNVQAIAQVEDTAAVLETAVGTGTTLEVVALKRLVKSPFNVRKQAPKRIEELAENIRANGLLQNLVGHVIKGRAKLAKIGVAAGQRRLAALELLMESGVIDGNFEVPVKIVPDAEAVAISLSENTEREQMHPADEFIAFKALLDDGKSIEYVAALFGIAPTTVVRRMKLVAVSPKLFELFSQDKITLEQLMALAVTDDHEAQETVWFATANNAWMQSPQELRARLTDGKTDILKSRFVKFVGVDAFVAAGGIVERDLFSNNNAGFISDTTLLMQLHDAKLAAAAEAVKAEGWSWVETRGALDYEERSQFGELRPVKRPLNAKKAKELKTLNAEFEAVDEKIDAYYDAEDGEEGISADELDALETKKEELQAAIDALTESTATFDAAQMEVSGVILLVGYHGGLEYHRGLVRPEDKPAARIAHPDNSLRLEDTRSRSTKTAKGIHSEKLTKQLTAHRTVAVQAELSVRPDVALAVMVHRLALSVFKDGFYGSREANPVQVSVTVVDHQLKTVAPDMEASMGWTQLQDKRNELRALLPKDINQLFAWLLVQPQETLLSILAFCTAVTIDGISGEEGAHAINPVSRALDLDMSKHWTATADSYFAHVSKARIVDVLTAAVSPEVATEAKTMKKADAAAFAEARLVGTGWTPEVFSATDAPKVTVYGDDEDDEDETGDHDASGSDNEATDAQDTPIQAETLDDAPDATDAVEDKAPVSDKVYAPAWPFPTGALNRTAHHATH